MLLSCIYMPLQRSQPELACFSRNARHQDMGSYICCEGTILGGGFRNERDQSYHIFNPRCKWIEHHPSSLNTLPSPSVYRGHGYPACHWSLLPLKGRTLPKPTWGWPFRVLVLDDNDGGHARCNGAYYFPKRTCHTWGGTATISENQILILGAERSLSRLSLTSTVCAPSVGRALESLASNLRFFLGLNTSGPRAAGEYCTKTINSLGGVTVTMPNEILVSLTGPGGVTPPKNIR